MVVGFHEMVGRTIARLLRTPASHANTTAPAIRTFPPWTSGERRAAAQTAVFARPEMTATTTAPIRPASTAVKSSKATSPTRKYVAEKINASPAMQLLDKQVE